MLKVKAESDSNKIRKKSTRSDGETHEIDTDFSQSKLIFIIRGAKGTKKMDDDFFNFFLDYQQNRLLHKSVGFSCFHLWWSTPKFETRIPYLELN